MSNYTKRYQMVHDVAKLAKEMEDEDRNPVANKPNSLYKEVNKGKKCRNYVLEAFQQIKQEKNGDTHVD